jgi:hypothetical protein
MEVTVGDVPSDAFKLYAMRCMGLPDFAAMADLILVVTRALAIH